MFLLREKLPMVVLYLISNVFHFITKVQNHPPFNSFSKRFLFSTEYIIGKQHHALLQNTVKVSITKDIKTTIWRIYAELCGPISLFGDGLQLRRTLATVIWIWCWWFIRNAYYNKSLDGLCNLLISPKLRFFLMYWITDSMNICESLNHLFDQLVKKCMKHNYCVLNGSAVAFY